MTIYEAIEQAEREREEALRKELGKIQEQIDKSKLDQAYLLGQINILKQQINKALCEE